MQELNGNMAWITILSSPNFSRSRQGENRFFSVFAGCVIKGTHLQLSNGLVRDTVYNRAAADSTDIEREFALVIGKRGDALDGLSHLHDSVGSVMMPPARVRSAAFHGDAKGCTTLSSDYEGGSRADSSLTFKDR